MVEPDKSQSSSKAPQPVLEHEESIYETQNSAAESNNANIETNLQNQNFTYFPTEKKVSLREGFESV